MPISSEPGVVRLAMFAFVIYKVEGRTACCSTVVTQDNLHATRILFQTAKPQASFAVQTVFCDKQRRLHPNTVAQLLWQERHAEVWADAQVQVASTEALVFIKLAQCIQCKPFSLCSGKRCCTTKSSVTTTTQQVTRSAVKHAMLDSRQMKSKPAANVRAGHNVGFCNIDKTTELGNGSCTCLRQA